MTGIIFDIQRFSIHDGPGIRTTVFLKGCPLGCPWCHNPEGQAQAPELGVDFETCTACGACVAACPHGAHRIASDRTTKAHRFDPDRCTGCGVCVTVCPAGALELIGEEKSVEEVLQVVVRDEPFYRRSGGGITLSGGEPLAQADFSLALLERAQARGLHTCIETSGFGRAEAIERLLPHLDLVYFDIKETDPERHQTVCGVSLEPIMRNLESAAESRVPLVLRCPIIPGVNDRTDHLLAIADLAERYQTIGAVHLLPYHRLGSDKQRRLPRIRQEVFDPPDEEAIDGWIRAVGEATGKPVSRG